MHAPSTAPARAGTALLALALAAAPCAADAPNTDKIGTKIERVVFHDVAGKPLALDDFTDPITVVVFLSFDCPVSNSYALTLAEMHRQYKTKGVRFLAVCPTDDEAADLARQAKDFKLPFPVCRDAKLAAVDAFKAAATPEAFVLDRHHLLRYRGRIDDGYSARLKKNLAIKHNDLRDALDQMTAGKPVATPATVVVGCPIAPAREVAKDGKVTYYRDVLPILQNRCQSCHRPGEVGPFALLTYKQAVNWASDIKDYTQSRRMPPWKPVEGGPYLDQRSMPKKEIETLAAWVDGGTPAGDPKDAPPPVKFPEGWHLGKPDLVLTPTDDFHVGPSGTDMYRCFVLPTNLTEDKYVTAVEVRPGNPRVVHHTLNFIDVTGQGRAFEKKEKKREGAADYGPGYSTMLGIGFRASGGIGGWAPGQLGRYLPEGTGIFLPKGSDLVVQVHYHRTGRPEVDRTSIGLHFAKKPVQTRWQTVVVAGHFPRQNFLDLRGHIPAGAENYRVKGGMIVDTDCMLHSVMPHMHLIGRQVKVTLTPPEGAKQTLVVIDDWDYNWQETYFFRKPISVKAGTKLEIEAVYDNSSKNPNNPKDPPATVYVGEQTTNEMLFGFLGATSPEGRRIIFRRLDDKNAAKGGTNAKPRTP